MPEGGLLQRGELGDDRVGLLAVERLAQAAPVEHVGLDRGRPRLGQPGAAFGRAVHRDHLMSGVAEQAHQGHPDRPRRARNQDPHWLLLP